MTLRDNDTLPCVRSRGFCKAIVSSDQLFSSGKCAMAGERCTSSVIYRIPCVQSCVHSHLLPFRANCNPGVLHSKPIPIPISFLPSQLQFRFTHSNFNSGRNIWSQGSLQKQKWSMQALLEELTITRWWIINRWEWITLVWRESTLVLEWIFIICSIFSHSMGSECFHSFVECCWVPVHWQQWVQPLCDLISVLMGFYHI